MSLKNISQHTICRTIAVVSLRRRTISAATCYLRRGTCLSVRLPSSAGLCSVRGIKTKTVIKVRDLPQGLLPPLPKDAFDDVPAKAYPETLQQHLNNMRKYPDCVLFTRVGDFYEIYFEHVELYAPMLGLKQAKKWTVNGSVPMAGFKHLFLEKYLKILVKDHGLHVAIAEQVPIRADDRLAKGKGLLFDRSVTRVITPGTTIDEDFIDSNESNYLLAIHFHGQLPMGYASTSKSSTHEGSRSMQKIGLSWVDLSSGDFFVQTSDLASLPSLVARIKPAEVVLPSTASSMPHRLLGEGGYVLQFHEVSQQSTSVAEWTPMLERAIPQEEQAVFTPQELAAGSTVLDYIRGRLLSTAIKLQPPVRRSNNECMIIDKQSLRGLEIRSLIRDGSFKGSLLHSLRRTVTKSGTRLLSQRIVSPSLSISIIDKRLDLVQELLSHDALREDISALLKQTSDTFRLVQRFSINRGDADDLLGLARTVEVMNQISRALQDHVAGNESSKDQATSSFDCVTDIIDRIALKEPMKLAKIIVNAIDEEGLTQQHRIEDESREEAEKMAVEIAGADAMGEKVPQLARRGSKPNPSALNLSNRDDEDIWIMRNDASPTLQRAHDDLQELFDTKQRLVSRLRDELKAASLTLRWSAKLGHHCQVKGKDARSNLDTMKGVHSVSLTKSTRSFYAEAWTHLGMRIDHAKLRIRTEEERVLDKLRRQVIENIMKLRRNAAVLDELDVACSSAIVAKERSLTRPILNEGTSHKIIGGRHPTVDIGLKEQGRPFTSNDCFAGDQERISLITGPNMGGKSTYLRQNALITILAQAGFFVPAEYAEIGLVDKIFSRVGSADNLYEDQSTFMVEMLEAGEILKQATPRSFAIMDEVGRGTTPEAGVAVSFACLQHLHDTNRCRTLFATHFHALADMTGEFNSLSCHCTDIAEGNDGSWVYMHKLRRGVNRESHALKVARIAGMPDDAIKVAYGVLARYRNASHDDDDSLQSVEAPKLAGVG